MATTEELDIVLRTVADTSGAQAVSQALQQTQRVAQQTQQQLSAQQQFANQVLRQSMAQVPQTAQAFQGQFTAVEKQIGARPTLRPEDFGISPQLVQAAQTQARASDLVRTSLGRTTGAVTEHAAAQEELRGHVELTATEFVRFGTAALGLGAGLSIASTAGRLVQDALSTIVNDAIRADQATRNLTATFGAAAGEYQRFATAQSALAGGFNTSDIEAATEAVRPLAQQFNLTTNQVEGLVNAARQLATIRDIPLQSALDALLASLQGNAGAAERLGLSMTDNDVSARAAGGAYRATFSTLTDGEKVMLRYIELLGQVDTQQKNVAASGPSLSQRARELGTEISNLNSIIGQGPLAGLLELFTGVDLRIKGTTEDAKQLTLQLDAATAASAPSLTPPPPRFGPNPLEGLETTGPQVQQAAQQALGTVRGAMGQLAQSTNAQLGLLASRQAEVAVLQAEAARQAMQSTGLVTNAITVALARTTDPAEQARLQQRLDLINALTGANQSLLEAQRAQNALQQQGVQLSAQQAAITLQYLPAQLKIADQEREINRIKLEGQRAALPATERLEDLRYEEQRARLIAQNRFVPVDERVAARRELRGLVRQEPGVELGALEAQRQQTPIDRALARLQIEAGLQQNAMQTALAPVQAMIQQNQLLGQIAAAVAAGRQQQVDVIISGFVNVNGNGGLSDEDINQIVGVANDQFVAQFTAGLNEAERGRSQRLIGAG